MVPELPPLPALTRAEGELIDCYLEVVDLLGRINPARATHTYGALRAAQALPAGAVALRAALEAMHAHGESEIHSRTLMRALTMLDGKRRASLVNLPRSLPD